MSSEKPKLPTCPETATYSFFRPLGQLHCSFAPILLLGRESFIFLEHIRQPQVWPQYAVSGAAWTAEPNTAVPNIGHSLPPDNMLTFQTYLYVTKLIYISRYFKIFLIILLFSFLRRFLFSVQF